MKTFLSFACVLACAAALSLPPFNAQAYLSGTTQDQYSLDPNYASLVPQTRSFSVDVDMQALQQAIAEYEASLQDQDRLNLAAEFDLDAFQKAYDEFLHTIPFNPFQFQFQGLKAERSSFSFDAEAYQKALAELAKLTLP